MILRLDAPITPDDDEARSWLSQELSRPQYSDELSPLTRGIRAVLRFLLDLIDGGTAQPPPLEVVLLLVVALLLVIAVAITVLNPIRTARRRRRRTVFDSQRVTAADAIRERDEALAAGRVDEAYVWAFRVFVLCLSGAGLLADGPGVTAHEASTRAAAAMSDLKTVLREHADRFDEVRYGEGSARVQDVEAMTGLTRLVEDRLAASPLPAATGGAR